MNTNELRNLVDERLKELLATRRRPDLREAMEYSVFAGGKRLRPLLLLAAYESLTGYLAGDAGNTAAAAHESFGCALDFACALEMIHTYSLIHDDLPAMDNDDLRRGKPTSHKRFGEAMAILTGDALLNLAYEVMAASPNSAAMQKIAAAAGANGMIAGQVLDMKGEELAEIHALKTGALFEAALVAGAIIAGAIIAAGTGEVLAGFSRLGKVLGKAFQLLDDILDVTASEEQLGKQKSDTRNNKLTYVSVYGLEKAKADYKLLCAEVLRELDTLPLVSGVLRRVVGEVLDREY